MRIQRINIPGLLVVQLLLLGGFLLWSVARFSAERPPEQSGDPIELRGSNIVRLRTPHALGFEQITITEEGVASRAPIPYNNAVDTAIRVHLSAPEQTALAAFRTQWCQDRFPLEQVPPGEAAYDLAVRCDGYSIKIKQAQVRAAVLPAILTTILTQLPPLPARR